MDNLITLRPRFRAARRYYFNNEDSSPMLVSSTRSLHQISSSPPLDNPLVLAAIVAGVIGVTLIAVIMIGVWIRTKLTKKSVSSSSSQSQRNMGSSSCRDSTIMSSMSTLDDFGNETQYDSIRLDDTGAFDGELQSVVIVNEDAETSRNETNNKLHPDSEAEVSLSSPENLQE